MPQTDTPPEPEITDANPNPSEQETIGDWTQAELSKYVLDLLERNPNIFLEFLKVEKLEVTESLVVQSQAGQEYNIYSVGRSGGVPFENSWGNFGGDYNPASYYRDTFGYVHLQGVVSGGSTGTVCFTLPPAYRPENKEAHTVISYDSGGPTYQATLAEIGENGQVTLFNAVGRTHLDDIQFRAKGF